MSLQFILGPAGAGKTHRMLETLIRRSLADKSKNYIVLVPDQFTMEAQRELLAMHPNHGVMYIDVLSFNRLAYRVFGELGVNDFDVMDETAKSLLVRRALGMCRGELKVFGRRAFSQGTVDAMKSAISEFMQYGIDDERLSGMIDGQAGTALAGKLADVRTVYAKFLKIRDEKFITAEELPGKLAAMIPQSEYIKNSEIYVDGFTGFTPVQLRVMEELINCAGSVAVALSASGDDDSGLFELSRKTTAALSRIAEKSGVEIKRPVVIEKNENSRLAGSKQISFLEEHIFKSTPPEPKDAGDDCEIEIRACDDPKAEAGFIAEKILDLVMNEGMRYSDIAVIAADMDEYSRHIGRAFSKAKIPAFIDHKKSIEKNPIVNTIKSAFEVIRLDYTYESMFAFLRFGMSGIDPGDIDLLENYVLESGIRGKRKWDQPFENRFSLSDEDFVRVNKTRQAAAEKLCGLSDVLKKRRKTAGQMCCGVYDFMIKNGLDEKTRRIAQELARDGDSESADEYVKTYNAVINLLDKINGLFGDDPMSMREFEDIFSAGVSAAKVGAVPPAIDGVVVGDMQRTRLPEIKALFFAGLDEDALPKKAGSSIIITGQERRRLKESGFELAPDDEENLFTERFYVYNTFAKPSERLFLSFSKISSAGAQKTKAYPVNAVMELFSGLSILETSGSWRLPERRRGRGTNVDKGINGDLARRLYGNSENIGITRLERFAECACRQFLENGLMLRRRSLHELSSADIGNLYHSILSSFCAELSAEGIKWQELGPDDREKYVGKYAREALKKEEFKKFDSDAESRYVARRIEEMTVWTVEVLSKQINSGEFEPAFYEEPLKSGIADRIDICEKDGRVYVRVVDYKSYNKKFSMDETYNGRQLQLVSYLCDAADRIRSRRPDADVVPAGAFYYSIDDRYVELEPDADRSEDEIMDMRLKGQAMSGILSGDGDAALLSDERLKENGKDSIVSNVKRSAGSGVRTGAGTSLLEAGDVEILQEFVKDKRQELTDEILGGSITANPWKNSGGARDKGMENSSCDYCDFRSVCGFDSKDIGGYRSSRLKDSEALEKIRESVKKKHEAAGADSAGGAGSSGGQSGKAGVGADKTGDF